MIWGLIWLAIAALATASAWRGPLRVMGMTLFSASGITSLAFVTSPFPVLPIVEIVLAVWITGTAAAIWSEQGGRPCQIIMLLAACDVIFAGIVSASASASYPVRYSFALGTNLIFSANAFVSAGKGSKMLAVISAIGAMLSIPASLWIMRVLERTGFFDGKVENDPNRLDR